MYCSVSPILCGGRFGLRQSRTRKELMEIYALILMAGMLLSLMMFAVKVGYGLRSAGFRWTGISMILLPYIALLIIAALSSNQIMNAAAPVLKERLIIPFFMAAGLILWGVYLIRGKTHPARAAWFLILPCPFLFIAAVFSSWAALRLFEIKLIFTGLIMGTVFILISLISYKGGLSRRKTSLPQPGRMRLGLGMLGLGVYFPASMVCQAKIEEARGVFKSFLAEGTDMTSNDSAGVIAVLLAAMLIGFFLRKKKEGSK